MGENENSNDSFAVTNRTAGERLAAHRSSAAFTSVFTLAFFLDDNRVLFDAILPSEGRVITVFMLIAILIILELVVASNKDLTRQIELINARAEADRLKGQVALLYNGFLHSGDTSITNEYTIKELSELEDKRRALGVNSYTQSRLVYLRDKVKRGDRY